MELAARETGYFTGSKILILPFLGAIQLAGFPFYFCGLSLQAIFLSHSFPWVTSLLAQARQCSEL